MTKKLRKCICAKHLYAKTIVNISGLNLQYSSLEDVTKSTTRQPPVDSFSLFLPLSQP